MAEHPLYPKLPEQALKEATALIEEFKMKLSKAADEAISDLYCNIMPYIQSDSWSNFRNQLMNGFKNYENRKIQAEYDFQGIRKAILEEYREDIIRDLNKDLVEEVEHLKKILEQEREWNRRDWR